MMRVHFINGRMIVTDENGQPHAEYYRVKALLARQLLNSDSTVTAADGDTSKSN